MMQRTGEELSQAVMASKALIEARAGKVRPKIAIVLGSGFASFAKTLTDPIAIPYGELPAFPQASVAGHAGLLSLGRVGRHPVALMQGRAHYYERGDAAAMKGAIRTLAALGCETLLLTNAAGSLCKDLPPGALMAISDHINWPQVSPLWGEEGNDRFVAMNEAYDPELRAKAQAAAARQKVTLAEGIYVWCAGPQFETPAEIRLCQALGAQAVGMSTVPETILARHAGLRVFGLSLITNLAAGLADHALSHAQTLEVAAQAAGAAERLLVSLLEEIEP